MSGNPVRNVYGVMKKYGAALVVLVACVFLAVVLFPTPHGRTTTRNVSCMSNMKQVSICLYMYVQDYDERFPPAAHWMDVTLEYVKGKGVYRCPDLHSSQPNDFGHGFNASLSLQATEKYREPGSVGMVYDTNDLHWNANAPAQTGMANPPRHPGGNTVGFADGHAKLVKLLTGKPR